MEVKVVNVTPKMAASFLKSSFDGQRKINSQYVRFYADIMKQGKWGMSDSMICFNEKGIMINGYHRMSAVVKADKSSKFVMFKNMSDDNFRNMDQQRKRSQFDVIKHEDIGMTRNELRIVNFIISKKYNSFLTKDIDVIKSCYNYYKDSIKSLDTRKKKNYDSPIQAALVIGIHEGYIKEKRANQFRSCLDMPESNKDWAATVYSKNREGKGGGAAVSNEMYLLAQKAITAFAKGSPVRYFKTCSNDIFDITWSK